jgi:hypothetical protein
MFFRNANRLSTPLLLILKTSGPENSPFDCGLPGIPQSFQANTRIPQKMTACFTSLPIHYALNSSGHSTLQSLDR